MIKLNCDLIFFTRIQTAHELQTLISAEMKLNNAEEMFMSN